MLREVGTDQEEAAATLGAGAFQTFWRITLPAIRWGVIYGVILTTARSLGEYGAVAVVSGQIAGRHRDPHPPRRRAVHQLGSTHGRRPTASSIVLALIALITVLLMNVLNRKGGGDGHHRL